MKNDKTPAANVDGYIAAFPNDVQKVLQGVKTAIAKAAPQAVEKISYQIPTFALNGNLVHFAAWKDHVGFYPGASGIAHFKRELSKYKGAKGSVRFPLDEPMPLDLIRRIVKFRVQENLAKAGVGRKGKATRIEK